MNKWKNSKTKELFNAFLQPENIEEMANFCRDLMTEAEIAEFAGRWQAAKKLNLGLPQRQVSLETGVSIATVTRVNQWLTRGMNGYKLVLNRLSQLNHLHPHPEG